MSASTIAARPYVFARVVEFDMECPNCGTVDIVRPGRGPRRRSANFNRVTRRWRCRACRRIFAIGLAVWPVARTGNRPPRDARPAFPPDTQPKPEQMASVRQLYGIVRQAPHHRNEPVNLMACGCLDRADTDPSCPWHGPET